MEKTKDEYLQSVLTSDSIYGTKETCKVFGIKESSLERYLREARKRGLKTLGKPDHKIVTKEKKTKTSRVLVISDLHQPFTHKGALNFVRGVYKSFSCDTVVFIGDIIDNAATSRYGANPDGYSPHNELTRAIDNLKLWYKAFPKATVIIGNHDRRVLKQMQRGSISLTWLKGFSEVLGTPGWNFVESAIIDNVKYIHGEGCSSTQQTVLRSDKSIVHGHLHSKFTILYHGDRFVMCVGWLGDNEAYAFDYSKYSIKRGILGVGVVLNGLPILVPFKTK